MTTCSHLHENYSCPVCRRPVAFNQPNLILVEALKEIRHCFLPGLSPEETLTWIRNYAEETLKKMYSFYS